eukprot:c23549_g1_i1 orf=364-1395(-)
MATFHAPVVCTTAMFSCDYLSHHLLTPWFATFGFGGSNIFVRNRIWGFKLRGCNLRPVSDAFKLSNFVDKRALHCNSRMASDNNGSTAEGFSENDEDYINSSVLEAVEVKTGFGGFLIKMREGHYVKCVHNNPEGGRLPDYAAQPAIVLKMEDGSNLLLPIIVLELPCIMLMEAIRNVHVVRPTVYHVLKDMIELMGFKVKLVRVTKRVHEAYYAQLYLSKQVGDETQHISLDLRPSDAINIAIRCQAPIQVHRHLAYGDGVKIVSDPPRKPSKSQQFSAGEIWQASVGTIVTELDRPNSCDAAEEFVLVRSMIVAAVEERYIDAARLRDELRELRAKRNTHS